MTEKIRIPTIDAIKEAHAREMIHKNQESRVRDQGLLESALARPHNRASDDDQATIYDIAAELSYGLARNHCFVDGNKRAAFAAAYMTLKINGLTPDWTNREAIEVFNALAAGTISREKLSAWFEENAL